MLTSDMATLTRFEDIEAWQKGRELRQTVYPLTRSKPFAGDFALVDQIRRAAISVGSNIAAGFERDGNKEFIQFLAQAKGSTNEIKDQLYCALDEGYITQAQFDQVYQLADSISRLLGGFMTYLRRSDFRGAKFETKPAFGKPGQPETRN